MNYITKSAILIASLITLVSCDEISTGRPTAITSLETAEDSLSYALGLATGNNILKDNISIDPSTFHNGLSAAIDGGESLLSEEEAGDCIQGFFSKRQKVEQEKNSIAEKAFLDENAKKEGVTITESGLQYEVLTKGTGPSPKAEDKVSVHYTGTLINGTVFDSSVQRGQPAEFGVNQVIPGWTEALKLMSVGDKWRLVIPEHIGYGSRGAGNGQIPPYATLVFEVELLEIK